VYLEMQKLRKEFYSAKNQSNLSKIMKTVGSAQVLVQYADLHQNKHVLSQITDLKCTCILFEIR
jgi:hypothetical protein